MTLPDPECRYGYPATQVDEILAFGPRQQAFWDWMYGQTMAICNRDPQREWIDDDESPGGMRLVEVGPPLCDRAHGTIVYPWDLARFIDGRPVID